MTDDEPWVPEGTADAARALFGGVAAGALTVGVVAVVAEVDVAARSPAGAERLSALVLALPPEVGSSAFGSLPATGRPPLALGLPGWLALAAVGYWTTARGAVSWPSHPYEMRGPLRAPHRLLANWIGRGVGRIRVRLRERRYLVVTVRNGVAAGAGYGLVVAAVVWVAVGPPAASDPWVATVVSGLAAACCGFAGAQAYGARGG